MTWWSLGIGDVLLLMRWFCWCTIIGSISSPRGVQVNGIPPCFDKHCPAHSQTHTHSRFLGNYRARCRTGQSNYHIDSSFSTQDRPYPLECQRRRCWLSQPLIKRQAAIHCDVMILSHLTSSHLHLRFWRGSQWLLLVSVTWSASAVRLVTNPYTIREVLWAFAGISSSCNENFDISNLKEI